MLYDTPKAALQDLTDDERFERVAVHVLRSRHPELRITGPTGDMGKDGHGRLLFATKDPTVLLASLEKEWTRKLARELAGIAKQPAKERPVRAIFATSRSTRQTDQKRYVAKAKALGVALEIFDLNEFALELASPSLRWVAELELSVRPQVPSALVPAAVFLEQLRKTVPGADHPLQGRDADIAAIRAFAAGAGQVGPRVLVVEGPGGIGKSRTAAAAAMDAGPALVARTAVKVDTAALADVPVTGPVTLIVDDAHRAEDLSGVAALAGDSRYDNVRVVLTARTGYADQAVARAGLADRPRDTVVLGPLDRAAVDAIVRGHGIDDAEFALAVINIAEGVPLIAHAAAAQAADVGTFDWDDAGAVLESFTSSRVLLGADKTLRAAAVALALLGSADGGQDVARLAGAVTGLPADPGRLHGLLDDLADAGLADAAPTRTGTVYTIRPHLVGPVLVAKALTDGRGVRIVLDRALDALGVAGPGTGQGKGPDPAVVSGRLDTLASAAVRSGDETTARALAGAVRALVAGGADADGWADAFALAGHAARAAPWLLDELRELLQEQWPPPAAATPLWLTTGDQAQAQACAQVARAVAGCVSRAGAAAPAAAAGLLLTAASLASPWLDDRAHGSVLQPLDALAVPAAARTAADVAARRREVLDGISQWTRRRLADSGGAVLDPAAARTVLAALRPLLRPSFGTARLGNEAAADVVVLRNAVLPAAPEVRAVLADARRQLTGLIGSAPLADADAALTVDELVRLAADLDSESRRPLPYGDGPMPPDAVRELQLTAKAVSDAVADRWDELPLRARHAAAASVARRMRRPGAAPGWTRPITARRRADGELARLAVIVPVDEDLSGFDRGDPRWQRTQDRRVAEAARLAANLPWEQSLALLGNAADVPDGVLGHDVRAAFARAAGAAVPELSIDAALDLLDGRRAPCDPLVVDGMLDARPGPAAGALARRARAGRSLSLALPVVWRLPAGDQATVLDEALRAACAAPPGPGPAAAAVRSAAGGLVGLARAARRAVPVPESAVRRAEDAAAVAARPGLAVLRAAGKAARTVLPGQPAAAPDDDDPARRALDVAGQLSLALFRGGGDPDDRMRRLVRLGLDGPPGALPQILMLGTHALRRPRAAEDGVVDAPALAEGLVAVLERRVAEADRIAEDVDGDHQTAQAAASLAVSHPEASAVALARLLLGTADDPGRWPFAWKHALIGLDPAERGPFAAALARRVEEGLPEGGLPEWRQFDVDQVLAWVSAGTDGWAAALLDWARGGPRERDRAVAAICASWSAPEWPAIVSDLLTSGVTERQRERLLGALEPRSFGPDLPERADRRYAALARLAPADDPAVTRFRDDAIARVQAAVDEYADDARRRRRGYS